MMSSVLRRLQKPEDEVLYDSLWDALKARVEARLQIAPFTAEADVDSAIEAAVATVAEKYQAAVESVAAAMPELQSSRVSTVGGAGAGAAAARSCCFGSASDSAIMSLRSQHVKIARTAAHKSPGAIFLKEGWARPASAAKKPTMFKGFDSMFKR